MRQLYRIGVASAALLVSLLVVSGPAGAVGYPPSTNYNTSCSFSESFVVGETFTVTVTCVFAPGSTITITFNGAFYHTETAPASGILTETFTVTDPHISLNGGPAIATAFAAVNTVVATGTNPNGGTNTATTLVTVAAPASLTAAPAASGPLASTGAQIAAMVIGAVVLIVAGFLIVTFTRRRRASVSPEQ